MCFLTYICNYLFLSISYSVLLLKRWLSLPFDGSSALSSLCKQIYTWSSFAGMLFCCTKLSVKLFLELRYQDMISVHCNLKKLLPNGAFSKAILSHENCISHSMSILSGKYTYPFFSTHLSKTNFAIASSILWTGFIPIAWLSALNSCTRCSNLFAWWKAWPKATKVSEYDQEIPQSHIAGQTKALRGRQR